MPGVAANCCSAAYARHPEAVTTPAGVRRRPGAEPCLAACVPAIHGCGCPQRRGGEEASQRGCAGGATASSAFHSASVLWQREAKGDGWGEEDNLLLWEMQKHPEREHRESPNWLVPFLKTVSTP